VLTFVDTPGAHPGAASEADGIAGEIARTFAAMATLPVPSVSVCVGEGGSGGALALAYADRLLIQEHAIFSVIAPEGAAAILERDAERAPVLAERLKLTSSDLLRLGIIDAVAPEDDVRAAVVDALGSARAGDRERRFDEATMRAVRP
jgi:acetyl-CoA carboxylase carboxyl transferase subunit beta